MEPSEKIFALIKEYQTITIWGHGRPDGDCYGSQIGLRELIRNTFPEKKVYAIGSGIPSFFSRLSPMDEANEEEIASSLAIIVDVSCLRRVEDQRVRLAKHHCKFDHHMFNPNEPFEGEAVVDDGRVSAAEIIAEWGFAHQMVFSKLAAESLYIGIVTDSGQFRYEGVQEQTFRTVADLYRYGVEAESLIKIAYRSDPITLMFKGEMVKKAKTKGDIAYCYIGPEDYEKGNISFDKACRMVNTLDCFGKPLLALFAENEEGEIVVELRGMKGYPVQPIAAQFGGGGHLYAAGCSLRKHGKPDYLDVIMALEQIRSEGQ